jgi:CubicO group peptidase (beta-lactamase class C family)/pimeloyl-ACP methyl ester carboxylesterase
VNRAILRPAVVIACLCANATPAWPQTLFEGRTVEVRGASLRYLDFGGDGLPIIFTQTLIRPLDEHVEIATRLSNDYRVLAVARRDDGGPVQWSGTAAHAEDLLGFLDALGIQRAVLAGNTDGSFRMTYLAEEHPERVAGLIYLAGPPSPIDLAKDPASGYAMSLRRWGVNDGFAEEPTHAFRYFHEAAEILVPALAFVPPEEARELEDAMVTPLLEIGSPLMADLVADMARRMGDTPNPLVAWLSRLQMDEAFRNQQLASIEDPEARAYFQRLAADEGMQAEMARYYAQRIQPANVANRAAFRRAFGERLRVVELDVPGHVYVMAPALIEPYIRTFLDDVGARDGQPRDPVLLLDPTPAETPGPPGTTGSAAADSVDAFILGRMAELDIPGVSVAVLRGNEVLKLASYGRANLELDVPTSPSTAFPYASITKAFTGTAILRLVERNLLALDDRVGELLPGLPATWSAVTVRQLLSHTSGLPDVARMEEAISNPLVLRNMLFASTRDSALALLPTMPLSFEAARSVAYNQTNYMLLAMLLERLDGRTIEVFVREEFAQPLGLTSLVFGDSRAIMPGRASWYTRIDYSTGRPETVPVQPLWLEYPSFLYTTAGLNGSALDLARFVAAVASGDLLSEASRGEMWGNAQLADGSVARMGPYGVALGWLTDDRAGRSVWMGGAETGAVRYFVDEDLTVAVLTNLMGAGPYGLVDGAAKAYLAGERRVP